MKKVLAALLLCLPLEALPLGNPWEANLLCNGQGLFCNQIRLPDCECFQFFDCVHFGFYGDYVFNRHLKNNTGNHETLRLVSLDTNAAYIGIAFWKRVELFGTLGATGIYAESPGLAFDAIGRNVRTTMYTDTNFSWSIGAHGTVWRCGSLALGAEAQYFYTNPLISSINLMWRNRTGYPPQNIHFKYQEWQAGLGATYQLRLSQGIGAFPYAGLTWSHAWVKVENNHSIVVDSNGVLVRVQDMTSQRLWGYALGFTVVACDRCSLGIEGRFVNETAFHLNAEVRF